MTPNQVAHLARLKSSGYLRTIEGIAKRMSAPLRWRVADGDRLRLDGGTVCFVDTGHALLGVSAAHVHRKIESLLEEDPACWCQLGGHSFDPRRNLISINDDLDIATYRLSELEVGAIRAEVHRPLVWPPISEPDVFHLIGGWPWQLGSSDSVQLDLSFLHFIVRRAQLTSTKVAVEIDRDNSVSWSEESLPRSANIGGMSGGPIYQINEEGLVAPLSLVGIISDTSSSQELVYGPRVSLISPVGTINTL